MSLSNDAFILLLDAMEELRFDREYEEARIKGDL